MTSEQEPEVHIGKVTGYDEIQCENCGKIILIDNSAYFSGSYAAPEGVFCQQCSYNSDDSAKSGEKNDPSTTRRLQRRRSSQSSI